MPITVVRLGSPRAAGEGVRLGTVRRPPRGIPKSQFATRDYYDVWLPQLSPSPKLLAQAHRVTSDRSWSAFARRFRTEMNRPEPARLLDLLVALSQQTNLAIGCYCEDAARCHRSIVAELLVERGADVRAP